MTSLTKTDILNDTENKQQQVYFQLKEDILNNVYAPGTIMVERKLCDIYNVSRSPIRNALANLTRDGLLTFIPGKGTMIPEYTIEDILEIYDLMEVFQTYAISACIYKLTDISLDVLQTIMNEMELAIERQNYGEAHKWDQQFHQYLIDCASNSRMNDYYQQLGYQNARFQATTLDDAELAKRSFAQHRSIFDSLKNKDLDGALRSLKNHYQDIKQYYIHRLLNKHLL